jgi:membrane protein DedA with SNARE-associated domain
MTATLIQYIEAVAIYAPTWGLFLVFFFMTVESSCIPFPSEVVMIPAGFLAAREPGLMFGDPLLDVSAAILAGTSGSLAGAFINYYLFSWLGVPFLEKYGKYFFLPPPKLHRAEEVFRQYGAGATFVCRLLPAIRQLISIPAGISGMPIKSFALWTGLGAGIWVTVLAIIGYTIGAHTASMTYTELVVQGTTMVKRHMIWLVPSLLAAFALYVFVSRKIMESKQPAKQPEIAG